MASTKDRQRAMERARYERVQAKMQKKRREAKRKQRVAIVSSIATVAVIGGVVAGVFAFTGSSNNKATAASTTSASASATASASSTAASNPLAYEASGTSVVKGITMPTYNAADAAKPYTATIVTNRGNIVFTALTTKAPYTTYSFAYLAGKGFFNNSPCPRISNSGGLYMLQCGDPSGTGSGGPGYSIPDENLDAFGTGSTVTYPAGTVAMANSGTAHSGGSQFFLVFQATTLAPSYTPFGTITQGLDILTEIAAKGNDGSSSAGGGKPNESVTIEKVTITQG